MELTNITNILISPPAFYITPIWFLRTKHAWYWTPLKPGKNDINKSNWMLIYHNIIIYFNKKAYLILCI